MARYSIDGTTSLFTAGTAGAEIRTASSNRAVLVRLHWGLNATPASAFNLALGRPAAIGVTPTSPVTVIPYDPADAGTVQLVTAGWGTGPTAPANFFRRFRIFHATWVLWYFPGGLAIAASSSLVLWNAVGTASAVNLHLDEDE